MLTARVMVYSVATSAETLKSANPSCKVGTFDAALRIRCSLEGWLGHGRSLTYWWAEPVYHRLAFSLGNPGLGAGVCLCDMWY